MKVVVLTDEEERILKEVEAGEWKLIKNLEAEKKRLKQAAEYTLNKAKNINIRLSEKDVQKLKVKAAEEGIPYQTLVSSVLHKFANKDLNI